MPGAGGPTDVRPPAPADEEEDVLTFQPNLGPTDGVGSSVWKWAAVLGAGAVVFAGVGLATAFLVNPSFMGQFRSSAAVAKGPDTSKPQNDSRKKVPSTDKTGRRSDPDGQEESTKATHPEVSPPPETAGHTSETAGAASARRADAGPARYALQGTDLDACRKAFLAVKAMGNDEARSAVPALLEAIARHQEDQGLRTAIVEKLGQIGPPATRTS